MTRTHRLGAGSANCAGRALIARPGAIALREGRRRAALPVAILVTLSAEDALSRRIVNGNAAEVLSVATLHARIEVG